MLKGELDERRRKTAELNLLFAKFPAMKKLQEFDFNAQPSIDRRLVEELAAGRYLTEGRNLILLGPPGVGKTPLDFHYDGLSRIRQRLAYQWQTGVGWIHVNTTRYMYDGRPLVEERYASDHVWSTYVHGTDLSGTFEGAGGIGSFLGRRFATGEKFYYHSDAMGNITALVDAWQNLAGTHKYDAFGNEISTSGYWAAINPIRFSSKVLQGGGIYDYGFRFNDPGLQRWLNRDPFQEKGGLALYVFVANNPAYYIDPFGLKPQPTGIKKCYQGIGDWFHGYIEMPNGNGFGFYPGGQGWHNGAFGGQGVVEQETGEASCSDVNLDPCTHDPQKFRECVGNGIWESVLNPPDYFWFGSNCLNWMNDLIKQCISSSERKFDYWRQPSVLFPPPERP